jgi:hypothetical protein
MQRYFSDEDGLSPIRFDFNVKNLAEIFILLYQKKG